MEEGTEPPSPKRKTDEELLVNPNDLLNDDALKDMGAEKEVWGNMVTVQKDINGGAI